VEWDFIFALFSIMNDCSCVAPSSVHFARDNWRKQIQKCLRSRRRTEAPKEKRFSLRRRRETLTTVSLVVCVVINSFAQHPPLILWMSNYVASLDRSHQILEILHDVLFHHFRPQPPKGEIQEKIAIFALFPCLKSQKAFAKAISNPIAEISLVSCSRHCVINRQESNHCHFFLHNLKFISLKQWF
jgi:hypothetical protein